jgi:2-phospho-L-lactate guanylyltransferase
MGRKSRLAGQLSGRERDELAKLLLSEVLGALRAARLLRSCRVVSPDRGMLDLAARAGARVVAEAKDAGVNSAVLAGLAEVNSLSDVLVIPADLPLLGPPELGHLIHAKSGGVDAVIAPSRGFDGTNALFFDGAHRFPLSYDDDSFWNHLAGAAGDGLSVRVCTDPGLTFDVDSPEDLRALALTPSKRPSAEFARRVLG